MNLRTASLMLALLFCVLCPAMAQSEAQSIPLPPPVDTRSAPTNDNFSSAKYILLPLSPYTQSLNETTIEANEVAHPCRSFGAYPGSNSVWFRFDIPQGRLRISTEGTIISNDPNPDTVMSLWSGTAMNNLVNKACNDDNGSSHSSFIDTTVTAGTYYLQISRWGITPLSGGETGTLALKIGFKPYGPAPANDLFAKALPVSLPYYGIVTGAERAIIEPNEVAHPCSSSTGSGAHSLWYKFTVPFAVGLTLETIGSTYSNNGTASIDTIMSVWTFSSGNAFIAVACNDDGGPASSAQISYDFFPGTFYVQVSQYANSASATGPSQVALRISNPVIAGNVIDETWGQGGFELSLAPWVGKNLTGDKRKCNIMTDAGTCGFVFKGGPNENSSITQTIKNFGSFGVNAGDAFHLHFYYYSMNLKAGETNAVLKIIYSDGTPPTVLKVPFAADNSGSAYNNVIVVESDAVRKVVLSFQNKSTTGTTTIDSVQLTYQPVAARSGAPASLELLPPPAAPEGFRGNN